MRRSSAQEVVAETARKSLPPGFWLRGAVKVSCYKALIRYTSERGRVYPAATLIMRGTNVSAKLVKGRKPRGKKGPLTRCCEIDLTDPTSLDLLEQWVRNLTYAVFNDD